MNSLNASRGRPVCRGGLLGSRDLVKLQPFIHEFIKQQHGQQAVDDFHKMAVGWVGGGNLTVFSRFFLRIILF